MKIFVFEVDDSEYLVIADDETEAREIYKDKFPPFEGKLKHLNKSIDRVYSIEIEKGLIYGAYIGW
jgi:hypothetical protein